MSTQSDLNTGNPIEIVLQAIMKRLDNLDEKVQKLLRKHSVHMISNNRSYARRLVDSMRRSTPSWQHGSRSLECPDKPAATTTAV
ncbi:hypothetical protein GUJ93_ZPchr0010g9643 [Zizania palustris]|uniref:Uncharacterized protein n=1 Tax=Zizania palustris TaxID=103762 RepID=A0A8J5WEK3_ZIZPA|nr:hypothetical protein GUJ93_ZPchr0010g9643 [Zizania palustris]